MTLSIYFHLVNFFKKADFTIILMIKSAFQHDILILL